MTKEFEYIMYGTIEEAVEAAEEMCEALETHVKITVAPENKGYELFGTGELVMEIKG
jgi:hypothetical protein